MHDARRFGLYWSLFLCTLAARAFEVRLEVVEPVGVARRGAPITSGIPFARGVLRDAGKLSVSSGGRLLPAQFRILSRWDDGSLRWVLMDTQIDLPAHGKAEILLRDSGSNPQPDTALKISEGAEAITIST